MDQYSFPSGDEIRRDLDNLSTDMPATDKMQDIKEQEEFKSSPQMDSEPFEFFQAPKAVAEQDLNDHDTLQGVKDAAGDLRENVPKFEDFQGKIPQGPHQEAKESPGWFEQTAEKLEGIGETVGPNGSDNEPFGQENRSEEIGIPEAFKKKSSEGHMSHSIPVSSMPQPPEIFNSQNFSEKVPQASSSLPPPPEELREAAGNPPEGPNVAAFAQAEPVTPKTKYQEAEPHTPTLFQDDNRSAIDYNAFIFETVTWENKVRSTVYFVGGLSVIVGLYCLLVSDTTFIAGLCYATLFQLSLNFFRGVLNPNLQAQCTWYDSAFTYSGIDFLASIFRALAALHDRHLGGKDPSKTLKIMLCMWMVSIMGRSISSFQLALALWLLAFSLPKLYIMYGDLTNKKVTEAVDTAKEKTKKTDRRLLAAATAAAVIIPTLITGYFLSRLDFTLALFIVYTYVRLLVPAKQANAIHKKVVPITSTATKQFNKVYNLAFDAAEKYELTPTPSKPKRT